LQRKVRYHGYTIERTIGPNGGVYTIWDGPSRRIDPGPGFNSAVEAQVFINRMEAEPPYFENDYRKALQVADEMVHDYLEKHPEHAAYFSSRATARFSEGMAEEMARLRSYRNTEDGE
jgi:hypothetical protein